MCNVRPCISVVVPVFHGEETIRRCLLSLIEQTLKHIEIIIVYKRSADNTLKEIESVCDSRIRILEQKDNNGPGAARNIGISASCGEYIGFVEADDIIDNDFYEKLYSAALKYEADIAFANSTLNGKELLYHKKTLILSCFIHKIDYFINGASFDKIFKSSLLHDKNILFSENVRWEDNPFLVKAAYFSNKIITVADTCYHYSPSSWSLEYRDKLKNDVIPVINEISEFINNKNISINERDALVRFIIRSFADNFIDDQQIYRRLVNQFGFSFLLAMRHYKKTLKRWRRSIKKAFFGGSVHG